MCIDKIKKLVDELKQRINPQYKNMQGTESYERRQCVEAIEYLLKLVDKYSKD